MVFADIGGATLHLAFASCLVSVAVLFGAVFTNQLTRDSNRSSSTSSKRPKNTTWEGYTADTVSGVRSDTARLGTIPGARVDMVPVARKVARVGHCISLFTTAVLTLCVAVVVVCFLTGDDSIAYVASYRSHSDSALHWLYLISGLWGGRSGSLLFWAWLISLFNTLIALRNLRRPHPLDNAALSISQLVLLAFVAIMVFSSSNMPFRPTPGIYLDADGNLNSLADGWGMSPLLEHWAMVIHPPALFIGYAGLTIPFAYALAAIIVNDDSPLWVQKCERYALVAWLFLGAGIGLGSIWAYVVLGWGGYWGWDPVENASLLSWLMASALTHCFTVYRQRGANKRFSVLCACLAFAFVIVGTFITRSSIVSSVHAFEADPVSMSVFSSLIIVAVLAGLLGLVWRRRSFTVLEGYDETEEMLTKDTAFFFNNAALLIAAIVITYLTLAPALPTWLPLGGWSLSAASYSTIARPLGILYCLVMALCPLLVWGRADTSAFVKRAKLPALFALVLFTLLMVFFVRYLVPTYDDLKANGGIHAAYLTDAGPRWYYLSLTVAGFAVASLLFFNSLLALIRALMAFSKQKSTDASASVSPAPKETTYQRRSALVGGFISHLAMAVILVGLIGSTMYVTEVAGSISYAPGETTPNDVQVKNYTLRYVSSDNNVLSSNRVAYFGLTLDVYRDDVLIATIKPSIDIERPTEQRRYNAVVLGSGTEDLFVVFSGLDRHGAISLDVRVIPLISCVWWGFALLMFGTVVAACGKRRG